MKEAHQVVGNNCCVFRVGFSGEEISLIEFISSEIVFEFFDAILAICPTVIELPDLQS